MLAIMTFTAISIVLMCVGYKLYYWFIVLMLALINSSAVYNEMDRKIILKLGKKDKIWKDVAKILGLEKNNEIH